MAKLTTIEVLRNINDGGALEQLNEAITEATKAVIERGGTAKVALQLTITKNGEKGIHVVDAISSQLPKIKNPVTHFFVTSEYGLSRRDEEQYLLEEIVGGKA